MRIALLQLAHLEREDGNLAGAIEALRRALKLNVDDSETASLLSAYLTAANRAPEAIAVMERYAKASDADVQILAALALAQARTGQFADAVDTLERSVYPAVAQYHYLLGVGLMALGDMTSAQDALTEADRLEPERGLTLLALGLALNNRKRYGEAKTTLSHSLELQPDSIEAVAALAESEAGAGAFDRAAAHAERALAQAPKNATAHLVMGMVLMDQRKYAEARDAFLKAADADPDSPKATYQLSLVFARLGDDANAQRHVELYREKLRGLEERLKAFRTAVPGPVRQ